MEKRNFLTEATWIPKKQMKRGDFYPCHSENFSFEYACEKFQAQSYQFKATKTAPRSGRHFMLQLPSGRRAVITCYDDFPSRVEISLETSVEADGCEVVYYDDFRHIMEPLGLAVPDKSMMGYPIWR